MPPEQARIIQSKGGATVSPQKRLAARIRELKKKGVTDETCQRFVDMLEDEACSALDIVEFIEEIKEQPLSVQQKINLGQLKIALHKAHFGEKRFNVNVDNQDALKCLRDFLEGKTTEKKVDGNDGSK